MAAEIITAKSLNLWYGTDGKTSASDRGHHALKDINVNIQYWLKEDFGAIALCEKGIGISIIPGLTLRNLSKDIDIVVKRFAVPRYRELGIALPSLQYAAPLTNLFVDTCVDFTAVYTNAPEFQESLWFDPK